MPLLPGFEKPLLAHAFTQHCHGKHQLNYQEFLELSTNSFTGLGLHFKPGQAEALFQKVDSNHDGNIDIFELMTYFSKSHDEDDFDEMPVKKRIALVAHDKFKDQMVEWCIHWKKELVKHQLMGTGTTGSKVAEETGLDVEILHSGPFGGDQQIGAKICEQKLDILIFFWDPLASMAHDQDVKALFRIASLYNVIMATNQSTANLIMSNAKIGEIIKIPRPHMQKYMKRNIHEVQE